MVSYIQEESKIICNIRPLFLAVTMSVVKASIKSIKRPRKASEEDAEGSDSFTGNDDSHVVKGTPPKRRKQAKSEQGARTSKGDLFLYPRRTVISAIRYEENFKAEMDFVGSVKPTTSKGCKYILVATDYCTKWVEAVTLKDNKAQSVAKFLYHNIMTRFGCSAELVSDRGKHFLNEVIFELTKTHMIKHKKSTAYHPQANGQAESTNKTLIKILKKIVQENKKDWDEKLDSALWSFRTAFKVTTGMTPFRLVYGLEAVVPMEFVVPSLRVTAEKMTPKLSVQHRSRNLMQLEEDRLVSSYITEVIQRSRKAWVSMNVKSKVLLYNSRSPGKLNLRYKGPYHIVTDLGQGTFIVADVFGTRVEKPVNGSRLKKFQGTPPHLDWLKPGMPKLHSVK
ncbi:hypothetical protein L7F22_052222 [Adiantum nelumboides]|nr:hypothetical protein [Adiantum nelumboides]